MEIKEYLRVTGVFIYLFIYIFIHLIYVYFSLDKSPPMISIYFFLDVLVRLSLFVSPQHIV